MPSMSRETAKTVGREGTPKRTNDANRKDLGAELVLLRARACAALSSAPAATRLNLVAKSIDVKIQDEET